MSSLNKNVFKNAIWIIGCKIIQSLISLVVVMISARYLGPSNYGLISYASSLIAFVVPLAELGLSSILVEQIVSYPEREGKTLGTAFVMGLISSFFCIIGCFAFISIANAGETDTLIVCTLYSFSLVFQTLQMIQYWYQAKLLSKYTSIVTLIASIIIASYKVSLLVMQKSVYWFALSNTFDYLIISVVLIILYQKIGKQKLSFSFDLAKKMLSISKYYILSGMMVAVFAQTDKIMIKMMIGNAENGYYSTAVTCAGLSCFVFVAIIDSMRPLIYESRKNNKELFEINISRLYSIIIYLGLLQSVFLTIFAKPIVLLLYGEAYLPTIPILRIITWYSAFSYMGTVRNIWILAEDKQKYLWIINLLGAILNVVGNYILIPKFGASGAAVASVLTQFFTNFVLCLIMKPIRPTAKLIWNALNPRILIEMIPKRER